VTAYIDEQRGRFGVEPICRTLGVSASAYYQRAQGKRSARAVEDERLLGRIGELHAQNYYAYGYRRMWKALQLAGERVPRCGSPTCPTCAAGRGSCSSPSCSTPTAASWSAGSSPRTCAPRSSLDALRMALWLRGPGADVALVHHSDRGSQYTAIDYTQTLADHGVLASVGSVGDAFDNALAERSSTASRPS
jgi:putative transposase